MFGSWNRDTFALVGCMIAFAVVRGCKEVNCRGEEVFRGNIDGYEVVYEEDVRNSPNENRRNVMTVTKEGVTHTLVDSVDRTCLLPEGFVNPNFERDTLEEIVVKRSDGRIESYYRGKTREQNLLGMDTTWEKYLFEEKDKRYNDFRRYIKKWIGDNSKIGYRPKNR